MRNEAPLAQLDAPATTRTTRAWTCSSCSRCCAQHWTLLLAGLVLAGVAGAGHHLPDHADVHRDHDFPAAAAAAERRGVGCWRRSAHWPAWLAPQRAIASAGRSVRGADAERHRVRSHRRPVQVDAGVRRQVPHAMRERRWRDNVRMTRGQEGRPDHGRGRRQEIRNARPTWPTSYVDELRRMTSTIAVTEAQQRRVFFEQQLQQTKDKLTAAQQALQASGFNQGAHQGRAEGRGRRAMRGCAPRSLLPRCGCRRCAAAWPTTRPRCGSSRRRLAALRGQLGAAGAGRRRSRRRPRLRRQVPRVQVPGNAVRAVLAPVRTGARGREPRGRADPGGGHGDCRRKGRASPSARSLRSRLRWRPRCCSSLVVLVRARRGAARSATMPPPKPARSAELGDRDDLARHRRCRLHRQQLRSRLVGAERRADRQSRCAHLCRQPGKPGGLARTTRATTSCVATSATARCSTV